MIITSPNNSHVLIEANSINEVLYDSCKAVIECGKDTTARGLSFRELHPATVVLHNPTYRHLLFPYRMNNPFAQMAETLWVLAGRNDVDWLKRYLPRAPQFSDDPPEADSQVWRAGYGPRLRNYGPKKIDQLQYVYNALKKDVGTRQAVINIWDATEDADIFYHGGTKDFPCNDLLQFMIRDGKLDLTVYVRSNDVIWGLTGVNLMEWTVLHELMAILLDVEVGTYYQHIGSLHIYNWHFNRARSICKCTLHGTDTGSSNFDMYSVLGVDSVPFAPPSEFKSLETLDHILDSFFGFEDQLRNREYTNANDVTDLIDTYTKTQTINFDSWQLCQFFTAIAIYNMYLNKDKPEEIEKVISDSCLASSLEDPNTDVDCILSNWLYKRFRTSFYDCDQMDTDPSFSEAGKFSFMKTECHKPRCIYMDNICEHYCGSR